RLAIANLIEWNPDHEQALADRIGTEIEKIVANGKIRVIHRRSTEIKGGRCEIPISPAAGAGAIYDILRTRRSDGYFVNASETSSRAGAAKLHKPHKAIDARRVADDLIATQTVIEQIPGRVLGWA